MKHHQKEKFSAKFKTGKKLNKLSFAASLDLKPVSKTATKMFSSCNILMTIIFKKTFATKCSLGFAQKIIRKASPLQKNCLKSN